MGIDVDFYKVKKNISARESVYKYRYEDKTFLYGGYQLCIAKLIDSFGKSGYENPICLSEKDIRKTISILKEVWEDRYKNPDKTKELFDIPKDNKLSNSFYNTIGDSIENLETFIKDFDYKNYKIIYNWG